MVLMMFLVAVWPTGFIGNIGLTTLSTVQAAPQELIPVVDGDWVPVAYDMPPNNYQYYTSSAVGVDFTAYVADDDTWHLVACVKNTSAPGATRILYHWQSPNGPLDRDWIPKGMFWKTNQGITGQTEGKIQAPHCFEFNNKHYMFYNSDQAYCLISDDGLTWQHHKAYNGSYGFFEMSRDLCIADGRADDGKWHTYFTQNTSLGAATIGSRSATSLEGPWSDPYVDIGRPAASAESPFVIYKGGYYYLFQDLDVYRSTDPHNWNFSTPYTILKQDVGGIPEIVEHNGEYYVFAHGQGNYYWAAKLKWATPDELPLVEKGKHEAESAVLSGASIKSNSECSEGKYADFSSTVGSYIEWNVNMPSSGLYNLEFRYATNGDVDFDVRANGTTKPLTFRNTTSNSIFSRQSVSFNLSAGNNTIRLISKESPANVNVDFLKVMGSSAAATPTPTPVSTSTPTPTPVGGGQSLFFDGFESGNLTAGGWSIENGTIAVTSTDNYTGTYSMPINYNDIVSKSISTAGKTGIQLKYAYKVTGINAGGHIITEWFDGTNWHNLEDVTAATSGYELKIYTLPSGAANNPGFKLRFKAVGVGGSFTYFDNIEVLGN